MAQFAEQNQVTVLLAEDDEVNQQIVRHILSALPFIELVMASDGKEALEAAIQQRFDLMIFDRNMPLIPGDRVIRHLKAARTINSATPIIQFTADAEYARVNRFLQLADAVVPKPVDGDTLRATVLQLLKLPIRAVAS